MAGNVLELHAADKSVTLATGEGLQLLSGLSLTVSPGTSTAIMGPSGSGKSTLLKVLGLFIGLDSGRYSLLGHDIKATSDKECSALRAQQIGFIFQQFQLMPNLNAFDNVLYACYLSGMSYRDRKRTAAEALDQVGLTQRAKSMPSQLSGGEQQRVSIARAIVKSPALILADEPTGALDRGTADDVMHLLTQTVTTDGSALIVVTHDEAVAQSCHRVLDLHQGRLYERT